MADIETIERVKEIEDYKYGFVTDIESEKAPIGLDESTVHFISAKKNEPQWLLDWRLEAFAHWKTMSEPDWAKLAYPPIDYQSYYYWSAHLSLLFFCPVFRLYGRQVAWPGWRCGFPQRIRLGATAGYGLPTSGAPKEERPWSGPAFLPDLQLRNAACRAGSAWRVGKPARGRLPRGFLLHHKARKRFPGPLLGLSSL